MVIGKPLRRAEDERLVMGRGRFVDDLRRSGVVHAVFVRSTEAHAVIRSVELDEARAAPGVVGAYVADELGLDRPMFNLFPAPLITNNHQASPLTAREVCYVGEPLAVVVAHTRRQAVDAAERVFVEYDLLPAVVDHHRALDPDAPMAHSGDESNLVAHIEIGYGEIERAWKEADRILQVRVDQHRGACASLEPRGVLAEYDPDREELTVWSSTQSPFPLRAKLSSYLGIPLHAIRVIAPDVGGGFGPKAALYAEEYVVAHLARHLERPVKWVETRREHFVSTLQQRDQSHVMEVATDGTGRILGLRSRIVQDNGAYVPYGLILAMTGLQLTPGPYVVPAIDVEMDVVYTNKTPTNPIRGAGRPYAVYAIERAMDAIARELDIDRAEVRRRNFVPADAFPYELPLRSRDGKPVTYDSGDYHTSLEMALEAADLDGFGDRRRASESSGKLRGYGIASYVEDTGLGPFEGAKVEITPDGTVVVDTGAASQGQGHATVFAQICADRLGVAPERVVVRAGDSGHYGYGISTAASRTAVTAGSSVHLAAEAVADLVKELASDRMEVSPHDLVLTGGRVQVVGQPDATIELAELAASVQGSAATPLPGGRTLPGLSADRAYQMSAPAYAFGTHVAEVEVDPETGFVEVIGYIVAHDCGTILNPMIVDGQIDGGVAHGLGNALIERVRFSGDGQPLATTFMDYRIMSAAEMPQLTKIHTETPSPLNPLGVKGAGEGGTLPAAAAVASAVEHALEGRGIVVDRYPLTPETVYQMLSQAPDHG